MNLRNVLGWCQRDQVNPARDAADAALADAVERHHKHYEWMAEKYVGRDRYIPEYVPEMREDERLANEVREKRLALDAIEPQPSPLTRDDMERERDRVMSLRWLAHSVREAVTSLCVPSRCPVTATCAVCGKALTHWPKVVWSVVDSETLFTDCRSCHWAWGAAAATGSIRDAVRTFIDRNPRSESR